MDKDIVSQEDPDDTRPSLVARVDALESKVTELLGHNQALRAICETLLAYTSRPTKERIARDLHGISLILNKRSPEMTIEERAEQTAVAMFSIAYLHHVADGMEAFSQMLEDMAAAE